MKKTLLVLVVSFFCLISFAQKKVITHSDYDKWMRMGETVLSNKGTVLVYEVQPITPFANPYIEVFNTKTNNKFKHLNGISPAIDFDENFVFFQQKPSFETDRKERKDKVKKDKKERNAFYVYDVKLNKITYSILKIKDFKSPEKYGNYVAIKKLKEISTAKEKPKRDSTNTKPKNLKFEDDYLIIKNLKAATNDTLFLAKDYKFIENEKALLVTKGIDTLKKKHALYKYSLVDKKLTVLDHNKIKIAQFAASKDGQKIAFLSAKDSIK